MDKKSTKVLESLLIVLLVSTKCSCQTTVNLLGATIQYTYGASSTSFIITFPLASGLSSTNAWFGLGFNNAGQMVKNLI